MPQNKYLYGIGCTIIGFCFLIFLVLIPFRGENTAFDPFGVAMLIYVCAVIYLMVIFFHHTSKHGWNKFGKGDEHTYSLALVLFSLAAHTLNLSEIRVFCNYTTWLWGYVVLLHTSIVAFPFRKVLPGWAQYIIYGISGASAVLCLYLTIFIGPLNVWAIPLSIALGISLMATVPAWMLLYFIQAFSRMEKLPYAKSAYWAGILLPLLILTFFLQRWGTIQNTITQARETYQQQEVTDIPEWVHIASELPEGRMTEEVMMAGALTQRSFWENGGSGFLDWNASEFKRHNPLAIIAMGLYGELELEGEDISRIMEVNYDARHMTHRRLWRGGNLSTSEVHTKVDVYPDFRLAYEEMTLHIHHDGNTSRWRNQQEAVYSFELPEGAVATSLSLWIEGEERFSRLTTKSKADSAYVQIVGVEIRDPALLHWQEGNRVSVTVFPCTPEDDRIVKIGFTTPLTDEGDRLALRHVSFDGPATWQASTTTAINIYGETPLENVQKPAIWHTGEGGYTYEGHYQADWTLSFKKHALSSEHFQFLGAQYQLAEASHNLEKWSPQEVILDVNSTWDPFTYRNILEKVEGIPTYVFLPEKTKLTENNTDEIFLQLREKAFNLLPLYRIENPGNTLVITKSRGKSPLLEDVEETTFYQSLYTYYAQAPAPVRMISLSSDIPPYLKTLANLGSVEVVRNKDYSWETLLTDKVFPVPDLAENEVFLPEANMTIRRDSALHEQEGEAPDHIARLYIYQDLMKQIGADFFVEDKMEDAWIRKAEEGYIVSPVSSMVVLETQKDYERFDIGENRDTLGNAAKQGDGAVPEPHEWALIILMGAIICYGGWKKWGWTLTLGH